MTNKVVLGVGAHPDDMDFTASGSIAKMVEDGWDAYYVVCTDGSRGSRAHDTTHEELTRIRKAEQQAAGEIIGLKDVIFFPYVDTQLLCDINLKEDLVRVIRKLKPNVVISMDPAYLYTTNSLWKEGASVNHSDHRAASTAAMDAVYPLARDRAIFPGHISDGLDPHITSELWFTSFEKKGNHIVDISGTLEKKINALAQHKSQFDDFAGVKEEVMRRAQIFAKEESFEHAESFTRLVFENNF